MRPLSESRYRDIVKDERGNRFEFATIAATTSALVAMLQRTKHLSCAAATCRNCRRNDCNNSCSDEYNYTVYSPLLACLA